MDPSQNPHVFHATTVVSVRRGDLVVFDVDGQFTICLSVM
jgi:ATP-dependent HslUV protease subunit HslV